MRRFCKRALAVLTAAAMLSAGSSALAAEGDAGISVQLDGQTLTFSDAAPEARDGRTFLPVRAVFEAMGAQVSYDAASGAVTAVRDGTTATDPDSGLAVSLTVAESMDADGNMTANLSMGMGDIMSMTMDMTGAYTQGTSAPETQPPEGAAVVDLLEMGTAVPEAQPAE